MSMHDWTRVDAGLFHHFHQQWAVELCGALNAGSLPGGCFALIDQRAVESVPDTQPTERELYARRANRVAVRNALGELVAVVEIVSPGNKDSRAALRPFIDKAVELLQRGVNLLIIDPFPPGPRDPQGIHKAIWDEVREEPFELPADKPLTVAAYLAEPLTAYVEPIAVGDPLPGLPIFLDPSSYIPAPLEASYQTTWARCPAPFREAVEVTGPPPAG